MNNYREVKPSFDDNSQNQRPSENLKEYYQDSHAIVIGINNYKDFSVSNLDNAVNDAIAVEQIMKAQGFQTTTLLNENATKKELTRILDDDLSNKTNKDDRIVVFFAGHGVSRTNSDGVVTSGYLIPYDGKLNEFSSLINMNDISKYCENVAAKHIFFILDCCFSGAALNRAVTVQSAKNISPEYIEKVTAKRAWKILTAGTESDVAADKGIDPNHSAFTYELIQALQGKADQNNDGIVTTSELISYIETRVFEQTKKYGVGQKPVLSSFAGGAEGDFLFRTNPNISISLDTSPRFKTFGLGWFSLPKFSLFTREKNVKKENTSEQSKLKPKKSVTDVLILGIIVCMLAGYGIYAIVDDWQNSGKISLPSILTSLFPKDKNPDPIIPVKQFSELEIVANTLYIRKGPDQTSDVINVLNRGAIVNVLDIDENRGWYEVKYDEGNLTGWIGDSWAFPPVSDTIVNKFITDVQQGNPVKLYPGIYKIDKSINLTGNITIEGSEFDPRWDTNKTVLQFNHISYGIRFDGPGTLKLSNIDLDYIGTNMSNVMFVKDGKIEISKVRIKGAKIRNTNTRENGVGLTLRGNTTGYIDKSTFIDNESNGISLMETTKVDITNSIFKTNGGSGVSYWGQAHGRLDTNTIEENGWHGIVLIGDSKPTILGNNIKGNGKWGIYVSDSSDTEIKNANIVVGNGSGGILVYDDDVSQEKEFHTNIKILDNSIGDNNMQPSIFLNHYSIDGEITNNTCNSQSNKIVVGSNSNTQITIGSNGNCKLIDGEYKPL